MIHGLISGFWTLRFEMELRGKALISQNAKSWDYAEFKVFYNFSVVILDNLRACFIWEQIQIELIPQFYEILELRKNIKKTSNKIIENKITEKFLIEVIIPDEYSVIQDSSKIFWATYNPAKKEEIKHIFIFSFKPSLNNTKQEVLQKTDSLLSQYLLGSKKNSYVQIEQLYPPHFEKNLFRGLWKLKNGFMGGPFIIKTHHVNQRIIVSIGIVFAPNSTKRTHVKTLEAIL